MAEPPPAVERLWGRRGAAELLPGRGAPLLWRISEAGLGGEGEADLRRRGGAGGERDGLASTRVSGRRIFIGNAIHLNRPV